MGYGVLRLPPWDLYRLTPGELQDMAVAHAWYQRMKWGGEQQAPMTQADREAEQYKMDRLLSHRGPT